MTSYLHALLGLGVNPGRLRRTKAVYEFQRQVVVRVERRISSAITNATEENAIDTA